MSASKVASQLKSRFDFIACLDLIVVVCIFIVAGRPDALAITAAALILGVGALIYRCTLGIKSYVARNAAKAKAAQRKAEHQFGQRVRAEPVTPAPVAAKPRDKSWLRDSE